MRTTQLTSMTMTLLWSSSPAPSCFLKICAESVSLMLPFKSCRRVKCLSLDGELWKQMVSISGKTRIQKCKPKLLLRGNSQSNKKYEVWIKIIPWQSQQKTMKTLAINSTHILIFDIVVKIAIYSHFIDYTFILLELCFQFIRAYSFKYPPFCPHISYVGSQLCLSDS